jgi:hypothetical protein
MAKRLAELEFETSRIAIPPDIAALLADANDRIESLDNTKRIEITAFVPSNFELS